MDRRAQPRPISRLVTQFDDKRTRATVATPTCCCCCCCVASIVTSTVVTALNVNDLAGREQMTTGSRWLWRLAAVLVAPLAVALAVLVGLAFSIVDKPDADWVGQIAFFVVWPALLVALYRRVGQARCAKAVAITVIFCSVLFCAEVYGAIAIVNTDSEGDQSHWLAYLLLLLALPLGLVPLLRRWTGVRRAVRSVQRAPE